MSDFHQGSWRSFTCKVLKGATDLSFLPFPLFHWVFSWPLKHLMKFKVVEMGLSIQLSTAARISFGFNTKKVPELITLRNLVLGVITGWGEVWLAPVGCQLSIIKVWSRRIFCFFIFLFPEIHTNACLSCFRSGTAGKDHCTQEQEGPTLVACDLWPPRQEADLQSAVAFCVHIVT